MTHRRQGVDFRMIPQTLAMKLRALPPSEAHASGQVVFQGHSDRQNSASPSRPNSASPHLRGVHRFDSRQTPDSPDQPNAIGPVKLFAESSRFLRQGDGPRPVQQAVVVPSSIRNLGTRGWHPVEIGFRNPGGGIPLWAKASHQPSSRARRLDEIKVGSRAEQVGRVCD
jgi:hypothetical protein